MGRTSKFSNPGSIRFRWANGVSSRNFLSIIGDPYPKDHRKEIGDPDPFLFSRARKLRLRKKWISVLDVLRLF